MVLKCLNHIYRLSTDVMFFTWSPFVWMKINWWQMRKDSAKRVEETYWIAAPPSGYFGGTLKWSESHVEEAHATGAVWGIWCFTETSEIKWFPVNCLELLLRKRSVKHMVKEAVWCLPLHFFLNRRRRQGRSTLSIHHRPHYHYHHPHNHHHH